MQNNVVFSRGGGATIIPPWKGDTPLNSKEINKMRQSKNNYDWHSSQEKEILDTMELIYAKDMLHSIWIPGTVLNRPKFIKEPRTYLINVWGKIYQQTREHLKARPTINITHIPRQETPSPTPTQTLQKKGRLLQCKQGIKYTRKSNRIPNHT